MSKGKAADDSGIVAEMLKQGNSRCPHTFGQCLVQWSTRKDAQDARKMVKVEQTVHLVPTHKGSAELPGKQPVYLTVHLTWEVQTVRTTHNSNITLSMEQQITLSKEQQTKLSMEMQVKLQ